VGVPLGLEQLQSEGCGMRVIVLRQLWTRTCSNGTWPNGQVKTGDSMSWTSLSIWTSSWTVMSRSAL
jgi:hypothetical protein